MSIQPNAGENNNNNSFNIGNNSFNNQMNFSDLEQQSAKKSEDQGQNLEPNQSFNLFQNRFSNQSLGKNVTEEKMSIESLGQPPQLLGGISDIAHDALNRLSNFNNNNNMHTPDKQLGDSFFSRNQGSLIPERKTLGGINSSITNNLNNNENRQSDCYFENNFESIFGKDILQRNSLEDQIRLSHNVRNNSFLDIQGQQNHLINGGEFNRNSNGILDGRFSSGLNYINNNQLNSSNFGYNGFGQQHNNGYLSSNFPGGHIQSTFGIGASFMNNQTGSVRSSIGYLKIHQANNTHNDDIDAQIKQQLEQLKDNQTEQQKGSQSQSSANPDSNNNNMQVLIENEKYLFEKNLQDQYEGELASQFSQGERFILSSSSTNQLSSTLNVNNPNLIKGLHGFNLNNPSSAFPLSVPLYSTGNSSVIGRSSNADIKNLGYNSNEMQLQHLDVGSLNFGISSNHQAQDLLQEQMRINDSQDLHYPKIENSLDKGNKDIFSMKLEELPSQDKLSINSNIINQDLNNIINESLKFRNSDGMNMLKRNDDSLSFPEIKQEKTSNSIGSIGQHSEFNQNILSRFNNNNNDNNNHNSNSNRISINSNNLNFNRASLGGLSAFGGLGGNISPNGGLSIGRASKNIDWASLKQKISNATRVSDPGCNRLSFPSFNYELQKQLGEYIGYQSNRTSNSEDRTSNNNSSINEEEKKKLEDVLSCNCGKTKCLKLYCVCFQQGFYCTDSCKCNDCQNKEQYQDERAKAISSIIQRNPDAFKTKIDIIDDVNNNKIEELSSQIQIPQSIYNNDTNTTNPQHLGHKKGCNCKKTLCRKKYCECFNGGVKCSNLCRCEGCQNGKNDGPDSFGQHINIEGSNFVDQENYNKGNVVSIKTQNNYFGNIKLEVFRGDHKQEEQQFTIKEEKTSNSEEENHLSPYLRQEQQQQQEEEDDRIKAQLKTKNLVKQCGLDAMLGENASQSIGGLDDRLNSNAQNINKSDRGLDAAFGQDDDQLSYGRQSMFTRQISHNINSINNNHNLSQEDFNRGSFMLNQYSLNNNNLNTNNNLNNDSNGQIVFNNLEANFSALNHSRFTISEYEEHYTQSKKQKHSLSHQLNNKENNDHLQALPNFSHQFSTEFNQHNNSNLDQFGRYSEIQIQNSIIPNTVSQEEVEITQNRSINKKDNNNNFNNSLEMGRASDSMDFLQQ